MQKVKTLLDIDTRSVLEKIESKYGLKLPRKVVNIDYEEDDGSLYIRFRLADHTDGEPTSDCKVILHYDTKGKIAAVEILDITDL
jgi:uncharacterized protein YuzE